MINGLFAQRGRSTQEQSFRLRCLAQFVQTKAGMQKAGTGIGRDATKFSTDRKRADPIAFLHQMMETKLQDFGTMLHHAFDRVQFRERLPSHAEFCISAGGEDLMCEGHAALLSKYRARRGFRTQVGGFVAALLELVKIQFMLSEIDDRAV
jgi:hypothetical protein